MNLKLKIIKLIIVSKFMIIVNKKKKLIKIIFYKI